MRKNKKLEIIWDWVCQFGHITFWFILVFFISKIVKSSCIEMKDKAYISLGVIALFYYGWMNFIKRIKEK